MGDAGALSAQYWADRLGFDGVVRIRSLGDCAFARGDEIVRIFRPRSKNRFRVAMVDGYLGFFLADDLVAPARKGGLIPSPASLTICPLMNFPCAVAHSEVRDGKASQEFMDEIKRLLGQIPETIIALQATFGLDFLVRSPLDRLGPLVKLMRGEVGHPPQDQSSAD